MTIPPSLKQGADVVASYIPTTPLSSGVYRMIDSNGKVLYVGKAKNLAKRLANYATPSRLEYRIQSMVSQIASIEIVTTRTEAEALLLEANLIKEYEPKYNILLRDDKSYPYILLTKEHDFPRILKHRGIKSQKGKYYGPFPSASAVNKSIVDLQKAFLIRPCTDSFFSSRKRPCIEYQIKRCSAPCVGKVTKEEYALLVKQTKEFLDGQSRKIQDELVSFMEEASIKMDYETAASYRDRIKALNHIQAKQNIHIESLDDTDVIGIYEESGQYCIQIFFFRAGRNLGNSPFYLKNTENGSINEILTAFVLQFYNNHVVPKEIITSIVPQDKIIVEDALTNLAGRKVKITIPKSGSKANVIKEALRNARDSLHQRMLRNVKQKKLLEEVKDLFELRELPKRIEVYDNSHIMGKHEIGAMIVAGEDGFNKKAYRKFNIKGEQKGKGDDYAMLEEVLRRRFKQAKTDNTSNVEMPDLVLIDGGAGHLSVATKILNEMGIDKTFKYACIAKGPDRNAGREWFFVPGKEAFQLEKDSPCLFYLQLLRDEAHRYAIGSHRRKRSKSITKSIIDEVPNIGSKRKKALLNHFGSADAILVAKVEDLACVDGISKKIAENIYKYLHDS